MFNGMNGLEILKNWPRFEDGEPVQLGDKFECWCGEEHVVGSVSFKGRCAVLNILHAHTFVVGNGPETVHGKRVKRLAVLAADGEPLEPGQTVWTTRDHDEFTVVDPSSDEEGFLSVKCTGKDGKTYFAYPGDLTHQRPVLDADGGPCCIGDEVWDIHIGEHQVIKDITGTCGEYETLVVRLDSGEQTTCDAVRVSHRKPVLDAAGVPIKKGDTVYGTVEGGPFIVTEVSDKGSVFVDAFPDTGMHGSMFTHAKPEPQDTWERIEDDATRPPRDYCGMLLNWAIVPEQDDAHYIEGMVCDLVRRCKALSERGE